MFPLVLWLFPGRNFHVGVFHNKTATEAGLLLADTRTKSSRVSKRMERDFDNMQHVAHPCVFGLATLQTWPFAEKSNKNPNNYDTSSVPTNGRNIQCMASNVMECKFPCHFRVMVGKKQSFVLASNSWKCGISIGVCVRCNKSCNNIELRSQSILCTLGGPTGDIYRLYSRGNFHVIVEGGVEVDQ